MKLLIKIFALILAASLPVLSPIYGQNGKKKVLILDFINGGGGTRIEFFSTTASNVFQEKFLDTGKFEIIPDAKTEKAIKKLKISKGQVYLKKNALRIAELTEADIVIAGVYKTFGRQYSVTVYVYNMYDEKNDAVEEYKGSLNKSVFTGLDSLAERVVRNAARKTESITPSEEKKRKWSGYTRFNPVLNVSGFSYYIPGIDRLGYGFKVNWQPPPFARFIHTYYEFEGSIISDPKNILPTWYYSISYLGFMFPFQLGGNFVFAPYVLLGEYFITRGPSSEMDGPVIKSGVSTRIYFGGAIGIVADAALSVPWLNSHGGGNPNDQGGPPDGPIAIVSISFGISYRIH